MSWVSCKKKVWWRHTAVSGFHHILIFRSGKPQCLVSQPSLLPSHATWKEVLPESLCFLSYIFFVHSPLNLPWLFYSTVCYFYSSPACFCISYLLYLLFLFPSMTCSLSPVVLFCLISLWEWAPEDFFLFICSWVWSPSASGETFTEEKLRSHRAWRCSKHEGPSFTSKPFVYNFFLGEK